MYKLEKSKFEIAFTFLCLLGVLIMLITVLLFRTTQKVLTPKKGPRFIIVGLYLSKKQTEN